MATVVNKSIGSDGGRDHASFAAYDTANQGNLITADEERHGQAYDDTVFDEAGILIDGSTTDATRFMVIEAAPGEEFDILTGLGVRINPTTGTTVMQLNDPFIVCRGMQIYSQVTASRRSLWATQGTITIEKMHIKDDNATATNGYCIDTNLNADNSVIRSCIIEGDAGGSNGARWGVNCHSTADNVEVTNCTIYGFVQGAADGIRTQNTSVAAVLRNIVSIDNDTDFNLASGTDIDYCVSSDSTATGANSQTLQTAAACFNDAGSGDFRPVAAGPLEDEGEIQSPVFEDITGVDHGTDNATWEVGAYDGTATVVHVLAMDTDGVATAELDLTKTTPLTSIIAVFAADHYWPMEHLQGIDIRGGFDLTETDPDGLLTNVIEGPDELGYASLDSNGAAATGLNKFSATDFPTDVTGAGGFFLSVWINPNGGSALNSRGIFTVDENGSTPYIALTHRDDNNTVNIQVDDGTNQANVGSSSGIVNDSWNHIAVRFKGGIGPFLELYINGVLRAQNTVHLVGNMTWGVTSEVKIANARVDQAALQAEAGIREVAFIATSQPSSIVANIYNGGVGRIHRPGQINDTLWGELDQQDDYAVDMDAAASTAMDLTIVVTEHQLEMASSGAATMEADATVEVFLEMGINAGATVEVDPIVEKFLEMSSTGEATMTADTSIILEAMMQSDGGSLATFDLAIDHPVAMDSDATATAAFDLIIDHNLEMASTGAGDLEANLSTDVQMNVPMDGSSSMGPDLIIDHNLDMESSGSSSVGPTLSIDFLAEVEIEGMGMMGADLTIIPAGGAGVVRDSEQFDSAQRELSAQSSAHPHTFHGQYVIPAGMVPGDSIRIARIPAGMQVVSMSVDHDALGVGSSGVMNVGTDSEPSAFLANCNILMSKIDIMTSGGKSSRPNQDAGIDIVLTFSGSFSFVADTVIRLVGNAIHMPTWQEEPRE